MSEDNREKINGNGEEVDTSNMKPNSPKFEEYSRIQNKPSEYTLEELAAIFEALGQIPVALDSEGYKRLMLLRGKIKNDFELKQSNINK